MADTNEQPYARVTLQMLYDKQLENQKLLLELASQMSSLKNLPDRVNELEIQQAKTAWIEKVAYAALFAGVTAVVANIINMTGS